MASILGVHWEKWQKFNNKVSICKCFMNNKTRIYRRQTDLLINIDDMKRFFHHPHHCVIDGWIMIICLLSPFSPYYHQNHSAFKQKTISIRLENENQIRMMMVFWGWQIKLIANKLPPHNSHRGEIQCWTQQKQTLWMMFLTIMMIMM